MSGVLSIAEPYPGILLDAYGVFWNGNEEGLIPGSKETMEKLISLGKMVGILSNSTQLSESEIRKLEKHGLIKGAHFHFFITSGDVVKRIFTEERLPFKTARKKYYLFGRPNYPLFQESNYEQTNMLQDADFIYLSVPQEDKLSVEVFKEEVSKIRLANLPMVCANPDRFAMEGKPARFVVRQGSIAALYEEMGGDVFYVGKPHAEGFFLAMSYFHQMGIKDPAQILMVGDTPETDIRGARNFGMASALITKTGNLSLPSSDKPHYFIENL